MKPIATIHWLEDESERSTNVFDQLSLESFTQRLQAEGKVNWTCLTGGIPPMRFKGRKGTVETLLREKHHKDRFAN